MLKKEMKKIFDNFYIFSKFALSFTLLICLIGILYVFFINYQKESISSKNQNIFEEELKNNINKNSELIDKIKKEIKNNEVILNEIRKNIETIVVIDQSGDILKLNNSIKSLNNNFDLLSEEIKNLKNNNLTSLKNEKKSNLMNKSKLDIIDLILFKYENNLNFTEELKYLTKIIADKQTNQIEKISILSSDPFKGYEYLKNIFDDEVNNHLKKIVNKNPKSLFSKIILPYLNVSPSSENKLTSDLIIKIKEIKINIDNRNLEKSLKSLITINNYENIFKLSSIEINKYIDFKTELNGLR